MDDELCKWCDEAEAEEDSNFCAECKKEVAALFPWIEDAGS